ncbi:MAG: (5-formylfuran-3-yl)methyl phosphate synthase, partial [Isosphaeraceae bacterium]
MRSSIEPIACCRLAARRSSQSKTLRLPETDPVAQLLVSVRSADEARTALARGASIIDIKEPDHGSLGLAPWSVWRDVHTV